jgi:hypothetical protein
LHPENPLTPEKAANLACGQTVNLDGYNARVTELFLCTIRESDASLPGGGNPGDVFYGFVASRGSDFLLARWNKNNITWHQAAPLPPSMVLAAFSPSAGK